MPYHTVPHKNATSSLAGPAERGHISVLFPSILPQGFYFIDFFVVVPYSSRAIEPSAAPRGGLDTNIAL